MERIHLLICLPACSLAISIIRFLSPANAAWMLLLLNIVCISCFSTCNAHFCPCLTNTVSVRVPFWLLSSCLCFIPDKMDTDTGMRMFCLCNSLAPVINAVWLHLLRRHWGAKKAASPYCVRHMHFCICLSCSILRGRWAGINEMFKAGMRDRETEREGLWWDTFKVFFPSSLRLSSPPHLRKESVEDVEFCLLTSPCE